MKKNSILLILAIGMMSGGFYNDTFAANGTEQTAERQERILTEKDANRLIKEMEASGSTELVIPEGYTSICDWAFEECTGLTSIDFKNVESIGWGAFWRCKGLKSIDLKNVKSIGGSAFYECTGPTSIDFKNVKFIGYGAFQGCTGLTSIDLKNVESIGRWAFEGCTGLTSIVIPDSITKIGWNAFKGCKNLNKVLVYSDRVKALVIASSEIDPDIIEVIEKPKDVDSGMALHHQYLDEKAKLDARVKPLHDKKIADRENNPEFVDLAEVKSKDGQWLDRDVQKDDEERLKKKIARLKEANERNKK